MKFLVHIEGMMFKEGASIEEALEILSSYSEGFGISLRLAAREFYTRDFPVQRPTIKLLTASPGSLDVSTFVDTISGMSPLAGVIVKKSADVVQYGWRIYKAASELITTATKVFKKTGQPMKISMINSPGAQVLVFNGDRSVAHVVPPVYEAAKAIHKSFDRMATQVQERKANRISINAIENEDDFYDSIDINSINSNDFDLPENLISDPEKIELQCRIYRLNRKSRSGFLDVLGEKEPRSLSFEIVDGNMNDYVDALKSESSMVIATREMSINALGETKVKKFFLHGIINN